MAETFFTPETTSVLAKILEPKYNGSVGRSAAWADAYAHTSEGHFSYQWHWIDTHDRQPGLYTGLRQGRVCCQCYCKSDQDTTGMCTTSVC